MSSSWVDVEVDRTEEELPPHWIDAEVDRRIALLEASRGVKLQRDERRRLKLALERNIQSGLLDLRASVREDQEKASYPDLAKRLEEAGLMNEEVYLRFGASPEGGLSRAVFGYEEQGVSAFEGKRTVEGHYVLNLPNWYLHLTLLRLLREGREAYSLRGRCVDKGSDGEPLIIDIESVEPVPHDALIVSSPPSRALEQFNASRENKHGSIYKDEEEKDAWLLRVTVPEIEDESFTRHSRNGSCVYGFNIYKSLPDLDTTLKVGTPEEGLIHDFYNETKVATLFVAGTAEGSELLFRARGRDAYKCLWTIQRIFEGEHGSANPHASGTAAGTPSGERGRSEWKKNGLPPCPDPESVREDWRRVFVRFFEPPPSGYSRNPQTGRHEPGVSCFFAYETPEGDYLIDPRDNLLLLVAFLKLKREGCPVFVLEAEQVGWGGGGEPAVGKITSCVPLSNEAGLESVVETPAWVLEAFGRASDSRSRRTQRGHAPSSTYLSPDADELVEAVIPHATLFSRRSRLHGPRHWRAVARNGARLCEATLEADPHVVTLFAALHDSCRDNDGRDAYHGRYAARMAASLRGELFEATDEQMELLSYALKRHADGEVTDDPTIGVCWDADRLDLPRCGIKPQARYLSTEAAKEMLAE